MNWILDKKYIYWIGLFLGSGLFLYQLSVGIHSIKQGDIYFVGSIIRCFHANVQLADNINRNGDKNTFY